jgi:integration host factor subunit alpha
LVKWTSEIFRSLIEIIKQALESGEDLLISGFGKFVVNKKNERRGRNPETGNDMILEARRVVTFRCSEKLKDKVNTKKKRRKKRK